jgi:hypothetical protein
MQRHCINHCQLENCPHKDEATVELNRLVPLADYSHFILNGNPEAKVNMEERGIGAQQVPSRKASIPGGQGNSVMGAGVPDEDQAGSAGIPPDEGNRGPRRSGAGIRRTRNAECKFQLCSKTIVGTRAAHHQHNPSLQ